MNSDLVISYFQERLQIKSQDLGTPVAECVPVFTSERGTEFVHSPFAGFNIIDKDKRKASGSGDVSTRQSNVFNFASLNWCHFGDILVTNLAPSC